MELRRRDCLNTKLAMGGRSTAALLGQADNRMKYHFDFEREGAKDAPDAPRVNGGVYPHPGDEVKALGGYERKGRDGGEYHWEHAMKDNSGPMGSDMGMEMGKSKGYK